MNPDDTPAATENDPDRLRAAARRAQRRERAALDDPETSVSRRLAQVGVLGWTIVVPMLLGLFLGRWLDRLLGTHALFAAALLLLGAGLGLWSAWRWMHRQ
ncbi:MAG: AtpZ/AtpI family protein [Rhodoferax sp.]|nr:AtpZ/AtpI family protein [Rhodoferax sp.]